MLFAKCEDHSCARQFATVANQAHQVLLLLITTPGYIMLVSAKGIGDTAAMPDVIFSRIMGLLVFIAFLADEQQWREFLYSAIWQLI